MVKKANAVWLEFCRKTCQISIKEQYMEKLEQKIGYRFRNRELLVTALTHSSYANENRALLRFLQAESYR